MLIKEGLPSLLGSWTFAANLARLALGTGRSHQRFLCPPSPSLLQASREGIHSSHGPGMQEVVGLQHPTLWSAAGGPQPSLCQSNAIQTRQPFRCCIERGGEEMGERRKEKLLA